MDLTGEKAFEAILNGFFTGTAPAEMDALAAASRPAEEPPEPAEKQPVEKKQGEKQPVEKQAETPLLEEQQQQALPPAKYPLAAWQYVEAFLVPFAV